jgi:uncharacterized protein YndB with AHSA1/START domain
MLTCTRNFAAALERVWAAHTDPQLISQWLAGPDPWTMAVCEVDARPGGAIHYVWQMADKSASFSLRGRFVTLEAPHRIVHVERMYLPDETPENRVETRFDPDGTGGTAMTLTMQVDDVETMQAMIGSGMTDGMEASYARIDALEGAAG